MTTYSAVLCETRVSIRARKYERISANTNTKNGKLVVRGCYKKCEQNVLFLSLSNDFFEWQEFLSRDWLRADKSHWLFEFDPFYVIDCTCSHSKKCEQKCEYSHYSFALAPEVWTIVCTPILCTNGNPTWNGGNLNILIIFYLLQRVH